MEYDFGGFISLIVSAFVVIAWVIVKARLKKDANVMSFLKEKFVTPLGLISLVFIGIGLVAFWLSVRVLLLFGWNYLLVNNYDYSQYQIFYVLAYPLAASLCFTLYQALSVSTSNERERSRQIIYATIQAVLIGILVFLPQYGNPKTLIELGGYLGFAVVLLSMTTALAVLAFVAKRLQTP